MAKIVVGVDGSDGSRAALAWAIDEGVRAGATVEAVGVWDYPVLMTLPTASTLPSAEEMVAAETDLLQKVLDSVGGDHGVAVKLHVAKGHAAQVLIERSGDADLIVVGRRGLGGFGSLLLGSVSQQVVQHAACPVVIVPH
jgi:nucleotide-binding universal stress UspA family protein